MVRKMNHSIQKPDLDIELIKKQKMYITIFFIGIVLLSLLVIGIMVYLVVHPAVQIRQSQPAIISP